ncbi:MAG: protein translocase SEC61 complex subunit gamma [Candidatus Bathyarchaeia archaeon]
MGFKEFIDSVKRLRHAISKPTREEIWMLIKISFLGIVIIGIIGFIVRILFWFVGLLG